jgi:hypothetical protein
MINFHTRKSLSPLWLTVAFLAGFSACSSTDGPDSPACTDSCQDASLDQSADTSIQSDIAQDDLGQLDSIPDPGTFLAPCLSNDDCDSAICIDSPNGKVCTKTCTEDCPTGFQCKEKKDGTGDIIYLCAPRHLYLCHPCSSSTSCNDSGGSDNLCVPFGEGGRDGSFCAEKCNPGNPDCPTGYSCKKTEGSHQCLPEKMQCSCNKKAMNLGLSTQCFKSKVLGESNAICLGERKCSPDGLSDCSAAVPEIDSCDNIDNDCDGSTDNLDKTLKLPCKSEANEFGQCDGQITSCFNGKALCNAVKALPESCNGLDDDCDGKTDEDLCDDGIPCTKDSCTGDTCKHKQQDDLPCDDGVICTKTDTCLKGVCVGSGQINCDDNDPCSTDSCDPLKGCKHLPASDAVCTDDGDICTADVCKNGKCIHPNDDGAKCVDEGNPCTKDVCEAKICKHIPDDGAGCKDDDIQCTNDVCKNKVCTHPIRTGKCQDGNPCTKNDICQGQSCISGVWDDCDDKNPCTKDSCGKDTGCVHQNQDLMSCTTSSNICSQGICKSGKCTVKPNAPCSTKVTVDKCGKVDVSGACTANGKCTPKSSPSEINCTKPCEGMCFSCTGVEVCYKP